MSYNSKENIGNLFDKFNSFIKSKTIVGEEIKIGPITLIPITDIMFSISSAVGEGKDNGNSGGGFAGIAAKATPKAILMVKNGETKLFPIKGCGSFESLLDSVPGLIEKINSNK